MTTLTVPDKGAAVVTTGTAAGAVDMEATKSIDLAHKYSTGRSSLRGSSRKWNQRVHGWCIWCVLRCLHLVGASAFFSTSAGAAGRSPEGRICVVTAGAEMTSKPVAETVKGPIARPVVSALQRERYTANGAEGRESPHPRLKPRGRERKRTECPPEVVPNTVGLGITLRSSFFCSLACRR
ncbi:hypothetical protein HPG69_009430 [Diceros bicornis minor]|uniref:Uncharacterized protein n=1 Tax=Diceros bicornis minor TaxID=77932 RepID=A0A7J7F2W7_DICBM|nr:hypothetical protein HPG69_009430 [Diceros bicornis minor]